MGVPKRGGSSGSGARWLARHAEISVFTGAQSFRVAVPIFRKALTYLTHQASLDFSGGRGQSIFSSKKLSGEGAAFFSAWPISASAPPRRKSLAAVLQSDGTAYTKIRHLSSVR